MLPPVAKDTTLLVPFSYVGWAVACLLFVPVVPTVMAQEATTPIVLEGDTLYGEMQGLTVLEGQALLEQGVLRIEADRLEYDAQKQQAVAKGEVRIEQNGDRISGTQLRYNTQDRTGTMDNPRFVLSGREQGGRARGEAKSVDLLKAGKLRTKEVRYTTCACGDDGVPAWELRANSMTIDKKENVGYAKGAHLRFYDTPILGVPAITFPVTDERKSGLLPPTLSVDSVSGFGWKQPYYWNIAPQYDATFYPTVMSKRGINLGNEFRYLGKNYNGSLQLDYMPNDRLRKKDRWGVGWRQHMDFAMPLQPLTAYDSFTLDAQINRVSDNDYWRDFSDSHWTKRFLPSELRLNLDYGRWNARAQALKWQTQQVRDSIVEVPYNRLPQLNLSYQKQDGVGWDYEFGGEWVRFEGDEKARQQPNGNRGRLYAEASYLYDQSLWRIRPKLRLDHTKYWLDAPLRAGGRRTISRTLPTFSLDASMQFERQTTLLGKAYMQTLEPRAFYVYTPYKNQADIPIYGTAKNTFNFASIFSENTFTGHDRKSDNNLLTLGATSRYIDPEDGAERLRLAFAQRIRFDKRLVTLPGEQGDDAGWGDMLFGADVKISERWKADGVIQYNPDKGNSDRIALNLNYHPAPYKVLNFAYRFQRKRSEYFDTSWQWPLAALTGQRGTKNNASPLDNWYTVGRVSYSHRDKKITDSLLGLEYDGQCWVGRVVVQRNQTGRKSNKRIMAQLEFTGLSSLGADPLDALKRNIERYQRIRYERGNEDAY